MEFEKYYNSLFRTHYSQFISQIPDESRYHDDPERKEIITIQRSRLSNKYNYLNFLKKEEYNHFIIAMYYSILVDMVFFTYYQEDYHKFQSLTQYPKFIGDCLSTCRFHLEPNDIFKIISRKIDYKKNLSEAIPVMKIEVLNFLKDYLPEIDGEIFWNRCTENLPILNKTHSK
jgi:hypothetical protein